MPRILLVDDDLDLIENIGAYLERETFKVDLAGNTEDARFLLKDDIYDLVVLDWNMPGDSGIDLCRWLRSAQRSTAILMLTANDSIDSKETGFSAGADDYLTKPFEIRELLARVRALLQRPRQLMPKIVDIGDLRINLDMKTVARGETSIHLKPMEFAVLEYFLRHPGELVKPEALLLSVWDQDSESTVDAVYICVGRLRKKLGMTEAGAPIRTQHKLGYVYVPPDDSNSTNSTS